MQQPRGTTLVAGALTLSGIAHLARPQAFEPLIPPRLGNPTAWVYASGVAELVGGAGLATRRPWAPAVSTATLAVIWIGNVQMAADVQRSNRPAWQKAATWARIPAQLPMMWAAWTSPVRPARDA